MSPVIEDRIKATRSSQIDDSGYNSQHTMVVHTPSLLHSDTNGQMVITFVQKKNLVTIFKQVEAQLMPHGLGDDASIISDDSAWNEELLPGPDVSWSDLKNLEHLSQEVTNKGSHKSEVQLRFVQI